METDKRKTVYDVLKEKTGYRDNYEDFNKIIDKDVDARNKVYNVLKDKTGYKDSFDDFNKVMGAITSSPVDQNDTSPTAPVNPTADNTNKPTSRFVQGKGKDATIFGVPYRIYKHLAPESQSFYYQQALDKEKQNVADAISNQAESVQKQAEEAYDARANKINEENIKFKKEHPFLNFIKEMAQMGRPVPLEPTLEDTDKDLRTLQGVVESAQTAKQTISEAGKKGNTNFVGGLGRGMRDMAGRGSTWDMGVLDLNKNVALSSAANKYIKGQELNKTEKLLLRVAAIEQVAMDEFSSDLGRGYKMGSTTVQSLPFMAEFLINPLSGSGKAIGKGVMKQGLKAIGKELPAGMLGKVANGATRVLGDVSAATGMALTTGSVHTTADFVDRKNGNIDYLVDEDGQVKYDGHTGGVGTGEAAYKAIASSVIENLSEMSGSYFDVLGKGVNSLMGKAVEKSALVKRLGNAVNTSKVAELYRNVSSSELAKTVTDFERKTGFHGTIEEYGEEVVGTVLNAIFTGDQSFSDLSDVDQQIDTFLGVSGIGGLFSAVKTVGYRAPLHRVNREIGKLNKKLSVSMGEDWSGVSDVLQSAEVEERKKYLGNILQGEGITDEVKRELFEYVGALTRRDAIKSGKVKQVSEGEDSAENVIVDDEVEEHYENGYNIISPNEKNNAKIALEETIKAIANRYPDMAEDDVTSTINSYGETPSEILMYLNDEKRAFSPEYVSQVTDYLNAKAQYEGMIDNVRDGMETEIDTQMDYITKNTHLDGNLYNATMKVDDRRVYVTGGNVIVGEDGMIDHQKSDKSIVVRDAQTGRIEMVDVRDMQSVQPGTNAEQHKAQIADQIKLGYAEKAAAEINGILPFNAGDTYTILNPETGTREEVVIQQADGDLVTIKGVDGKETQTTRDEVQTLVDRERLLSFNEQFQQNSPATHTNMKVLDDGRVISETSSNDTEVAFDVLDKEGNIIDSDVMPKEEFDKLHDFEKESEVELSDDGLPVVNDETVSSSDKSPVLADEQAINANETDRNSVQEPGVVMQDAGILPTHVENNSPVQEEVQKPMIPVDEEGNPQYHLAPVEVTIEDLTSPVEMDGEIYEPTDEEIDGLVLANKEEASKKFEKLSGKPPKIGANKSKYFAAKKQWTKQVADAKAQVDYWNEVEAQMKLLRQQPGDTTAEDIKAMGEPMTGEELAAMMLGAGKLPLLHSEYKRETGFGNTDASKMFGLFASKEKGGMTIEQAGEQLMLADLESGTNFFDQNDPNAGRNAIIDVLSSARTRGGLIDYIKNNRETMAERERQAEIEADELAKEQWLQDITHMTSEERDLWKQGELLTESNVVPKDGIIEFYNTFVDDILNEEAYDSRRERTDDHRIEEGQSNELGGVYGSREGGYEVLQGEEIVSPGRVEGYQGEPGEVAGRSNESLHPTDDSLQDSSSPRELTQPSGNQEKVSRINLPSRMEGESILDYASRVNDAHVLHKEEQKVNAQPTDAQKEAGNYRKGHIKVDGFDVTIENPQGSERSGVDAEGKPWSVTMNNTYGYIRGTKGADGDHIDLFLGNSGNGVFVVDQVKEDGSFDEHKVMYGFDSLDEAREAYLSNYSPGWKGLGSITGVSKETFKEWVDSSRRKTKPFAEYKLVQERAEGKRDGSVREEDGSDVRFREGKAESEEQSIIDRAKADGTYMKAPNGKPSNLDESQWVQVRTQAFKKSFGDWEKAARIEKLRKNTPVEITGEEYKGQYELNRESAQKYILNNLRGEYTINDTGERVQISKKGAKKVTSHSQGSEAHMQSIVAIPELIGNSVFIEERPAYKDNAQYDSYRYYVTGLKIGVEDYTARITIGVKNGEFYYDHYLTDIEKGNLIEAAQSFKPTEDAPNPSYAGNKDNVLFSLLQINLSKVVDENGEPLLKDDVHDNTGTFSFENDDIRFREVKEKDGSKSLIGLHNISQEKLLKALKLGGFANPSAAVIDINRQTHEGYGEISLVLPSSMIAKSTGRNAGTFSGDAWTPTYPQIERQFTDEGSNRVRDDISKLPKEMQPDVRSAWNSYMDGRNADALAYQFLYEKGEAPELRRIEPVFSEDIRKKVIDADALDDYNERNVALLDAYINENFNGDRAKFEEYIEERKRILQKKIDEIPSDKGFRRRKAVERLNDIEERGYEYDSVKEFYDKVLSDIRKSGGVDTYHAIQDALDKINQSEALGKEYNEWKGELADRYNINEVLFKGYTSSGNRVYLPHTLENVSRIMKEEGLAGATGWGGSFSKFAAGLMKSVGTLNGIRQQKEKLTTNHEDIDAFREKWEKVYFDLGIKLNPGASAFDDTGLYRVEEIATRPNPKSFAKREYGVELSDEDVQQLKEMIEAIRNEYPAMYFETKFERPVYLNEFAAAVLPDNVSPKVIDAASNAGLQIFSYKSGDEASRDEAVKEASKINGVRFRDMKTYHGSGAEFDKFDLNHVGEGEGESMLGKGVYTSKSKRIAKNYAGVARNKDKDGNKHLYEVNIPKDNGRNYLDYDKVYTAKEMEGVIEKLRGAGIGVGDIFSKYIPGRKANGMNFYRVLSINMPKGTDINEALSKVGYVGVKYSTRHDWDGKDMLFSKKSYVVFNPENANIVGHNQIKSEVLSISEKLHTPVRVINSIDELSDGVAKEAIGKGRKIKGWYDIGAGEVVLYLPHTASIDDGLKTVLHEVVGHKGLRQLFGEENYDAKMMRLFGQLPEDVRRNVADVAVRNYNSDVSIAMDEYLAEQAEKNETPSWWDKVVSAIRDLLRKVGVNVSLSENDVKYLLWRSRKNLERTPLDLAADIDMRNRLEIGEYNEKGKRFRDDSNPNEEDLFGEPFDGSKGKKPSLLEAYKNRIFELSNRISALERKIDTYESTEELANVVIEEIKKEIGSDIISEIGKKELNSLLMQVKNAKTKKSLEKIFMNVKKIALAAQSRKLQRVMDKLLALKVQDVNGKNMSIAKNVDDSTRRIFSFIRGKLSDIKKSGLEDDILYLKRENRSAQEEIKCLERTVRDTDDSSVKDEAMSSIEKHKKSIEDNKVRIQELRDEKNELERQIAGATDIDVEKEMSALDEKMDKAAQGEAIWTQGDTERMAALNIISGQIMNKSHDFEIQSIELDIQKRLMNNSDLYKDRMKEVSENKRRIITNAIKENKRQVVALERLITDTRAMQIKQQQMTIEQLEELISNGKNSLLRRTEGEVKRKSHIIGQAIQTVEGKPIDLYDKKSTDEGVLKKFFSAPLGSFEYMCKRVNTKTLGKDGFLYKYFVEGKDGVMEAYNTYVLGMEEFRKRLDEKSKKIFGKEYEKIWSQSDKVVNDLGVHVVDVNKEQRILGGINGYGVRYEIPLSKGQAMYIYQVWKMDDGRTKLELQGFDEESITEIRDFIGDDYIKFADWVQDELLPDLRERYNEKYLEMYGTSLAEIKDYVPLRIAKKSTRQESDLSEDKERKKTLEERAGSLIKRVVNTKPVDITMSAFDVLFDHGRQMEEWNAYARVRRDLDAVLSNTTFRNQLDANTRGSFRNFYDAAAVATKTYHPDQNRFMDEVIGKLSKGIVGGNIAWRLSTALKQILSAPAFWGYSQSPRYMKSLLTNTAKMPVTFKWCMENIPSFKERVSSGTIGNEKLEEKSISKYLDKYIETGMIPNKMVDAVTCSIGAKSIFDYRYGQLLRQGLKDEEARNQALMDADIYYNQTQQSSHPAFLSPMQMSRSIMDRMLTTYQNSNIGYVRKVMAAFYDLTRSLKWRELQKNYMDMYMKEGLNKDEATRKAYHRLLNENKKTAFEAILFAWGMNLLWNIGSQGLLGLFAGDGDDDDDLSKGISLFLTSPIKGMPGGNLLESIASGYGMNPLLVYDELDKFMKEINYAIDEYGLISPEIAFATMEKVSRYGGVDLEVLGNIYLGIEGLSRDGALDDDKMIDFMYMLNSPKSNRAAVAKELYKDETVASFAEKVARANKYISKRDPWEGWVPGAKDLTKRRKKDIEKEYERLHMTDDEKKTADEKKVADKHRRKLKELDDDPFALADYIDRHREEHKLYQKYY